MRMNFKVSFYLRSNYENKEGKSPVMLRVFLNGEMVEWSSTTVLKTVVPRGTGGSNPSLSANRLQKDFTIVVILAFKI